MSSDSDTPATANGIDKTIATRYFTGAYAVDLESQARLQRFTDRARWVAGVVGAVLFLMMLHAIWRHSGGKLLVWPLPPEVIGASGFFGLVLLGAALIRGLWRHGPALPTITILALAAVEVFSLHYAHRWLTLIILAVTLAIAVAWVHRWAARRSALPDIAELEPKLDLWTEQLLRRLSTGAEVPIGDLQRAQCDYFLRTFPKQDRIGTVRRLYRKGRDMRPRISPIGVGAFVFQQDTLVVIEGAIDLTSEAVLYRRAYEVKYADIVSMAWMSDLVDMTPTAAAGASAGATSRSGQRAKSHRDSLEIGLAGGRDISLVLRDGTFLPPDQAGVSDVERLESLDTVRKLWADVMARSRAAADPSRPPTGVA